MKGGVALPISRFMAYFFYYWLYSLMINRKEILKIDKTASNTGYSSNFPPLTAP